MSSIATYTIACETWWLLILTPLLITDQLTALALANSKLSLFDQSVSNGTNLIFFIKLSKKLRIQLKRFRWGVISSISSAVFCRHWRRNTHTHNSDSPLNSFSCRATLSNFNLTRHHSAIRPIKQANKQNKQREGEWWLAGAPAGPSWPPRRDGLMTNWCSSSITLSTFSTPVALLNGSILSALPLRSPSSLTPNFNPPLHLSLGGVSYNPSSAARSRPEGGTMGV